MSHSSKKKISTVNCCHKNFKLEVIEVYEYYKSDSKHFDVNHFWLDTKMSPKTRKICHHFLHYFCEKFYIV